MKRFMMWFFAAVLFLPLTAGAESINNDVDTRTSQSLVDSSSHEQVIEFGDSQGSPNLLPVYKLDGTFVAALPPPMRVEGWTEWQSSNSSYFNSGVTSTELASAGRYKDVSVYAPKSFPANDRPIILLERYSRGAEELGIIQLRARGNLEGRPVILEDAIMAALREAKKETGALYCLVLVRYNYLTASRVRALGTSVIGGAAIDPSRIGKTVISGGGGSGIGGSKAGVVRMPEVKIISFASSGKKAVKLSPVARLPVVKFDFDRDNVKSSESDKIDEIVAWLDKSWPKILASRLQVEIIGTCDQQGPANYNADLGLRRARNVALALRRLIIERGHTQKEAEDIIRYSSAGKDFLVYQVDADNRSAYVFAGQDLSR